MQTQEKFLIQINKESKIIIINNNKFLKFGVNTINK